MIECRIFIISFSSVISERLSRREDYLTFCSRLTFSGSPQICSYLCFCRGFHSCATEGPLIARGISTSLSPSRFRGFGGALLHTHTHTLKHKHKHTTMYNHTFTNTNTNTHIHTHKQTHRIAQKTGPREITGKSVTS